MGLGTVSYIPHAYAENAAEAETAQESNQLLKLEIQGLKLDQSFSPDVKTYSGTVENEIQEIHLLLEGSTPDSSITVNGEAAGNGSPKIYSLKTGENVFIITVHNRTSEPRTYQLTITRKQNANNSLKDIQLSSGVLSPVFSSAITSYHIKGLNAKERIKVVPAAAAETSTVKVNNKLAAKEGADVDVPIGESDIRITVTAENGESKTYNLHVKRLESKDRELDMLNAESAVRPQPAASSSSSTNRKANLKQNNQHNVPAVKVQEMAATGRSQQTAGSEQKTSKAMLSSLTVSTGTWDSSFVKDEFTYHIAVEKGTKNVTISPAAAYSSSTIKIEGGTTKTIQLEDDNKTIISVVVNYDYDDRKTYVLVFDRKSS